jgi:hypothetical protein
VQAILGRRNGEGLSAYPQAILGRFRQGCYPVCYAELKPELRHRQASILALPSSCTRSDFPR